MAKPIITSFGQISPLLIHQYEHYLPTAFDDSLSILQKMNKIIKKLDEIGLVVNDVITQWNTVMEWILNEGLEEIVNEKFQEWLDDGTWFDLINNQVLGTKADQLTVNVKRFGAKGDGVTNDTASIKLAIASLQEGDVLEFPKGRYILTGEVITIDTQWITIKGQGELVMNYGFRPKKSHFHIDGIDGLRITCPAWSESARAIQIDNVPVQGSPITYLEDFQIRNLYMENFFYAVASIGGTYSVNGNEAYEGYPIRDLLIENCTSKTFTNANAGHFQAIQTENVSYINNRTYGGQNATSYNVIKGNGFIKIIGNYDHNNSYGSCEVENASGNFVISGNTFKSKIWVDDSFEGVVSGNVTDDSIHITVGSNVGDAKQITVVGNNCKTIRAEQFGTYLGGLIKFLNIANNTVNGDNTNGIFVNGNAVTFVKISGNLITGVNTNDISIQRNTQLQAYVSENIGNNHNMLIAGADTDGQVFLVDNYNMVSSGTRNSLPASHLEREFNGLRLVSGTGVLYRLNVNADGTLQTIPY